MCEADVVLHCPRSREMRKCTNRPKNEVRDAKRRLAPRKFDVNASIFRISAKPPPRTRRAALRRKEF